MLENNDGCVDDTKRRTATERRNYTTTATVTLFFFFPFTSLVTRSFMMKFFLFSMALAGAIPITVGGDVLLCCDVLPSGFK